MPNGMINGMKKEMLHIDKAGRVVLPKPLRERFNLLPGDKLSVSIENQTIKLEPTHPGGTLVRKGSVLVFRGEVHEPVTADLVQEMLAQDRGQLETTTRAKRPKK